MLILYVKTGCPFCAKVIESLKANNVPYEEKNISDPEIAKELIAHGGKRQVPYMDDDDPCESAAHHTPCIVGDDVEMYESSDIVAYIEKEYGKGEGSNDQKSDEATSGVCAVE